jgi:hypothetical protein
LTDEELQPFVEEVRRELARAHEVLEQAVPGYEKLESRYWDAFRRSTPSLPEIDWDLAWEIVFGQIVDEREAESPSWARLRRNPLEGMVLRDALPPIDWRAIGARRRDDLVANHERAEQHVEDVEGEVQRLRQARDAIVQPQGLGWGLSILGYFTVVGVVIPTWLMSRGPTDLGPLMGTLVFAGFCSGLVALLGYMAVLAVRLSRRAVAAKPKGD